MNTIREKIIELTDDGQFSPPTNPDELDSVERSLKLQLPKELRSILNESNGVMCDYGADIFWSAKRIMEENIMLRTDDGFSDLYMPFDNLLFFGDDGCGDQFAFAIHADGKIHKNDVFRWDHETDERIWFAPNLSVYVENYCSKND